MSDVPLGAFLSGGVDSSIVVGLMAKNSRKHVKTFTVGYNDAPIYDESGFAREVARHFGTDHSEIRLSLRDGLAVIPDALDYLDQPFGDSSCIPTYLISRETRKAVTVALSGDGGDEVFAGYSKYQAEAYVPYFKMIPGIVWSSIRTLLANVPEGQAIESPRICPDPEKIPPRRQRGSGFPPLLPDVSSGRTGDRATGRGGSRWRYPQDRDNTHGSDRDREY